MEKSFANYTVVAAGVIGIGAGLMPVYETTLQEYLY